MQDKFLSFRKDYVKNCNLIYNSNVLTFTNFIRSIKIVCVFFIKNARWRIVTKFVCTSSSYFTCQESTFPAVKKKPFRPISFVETCTMTRACFWTDIVTFWTFMRWNPSAKTCLFKDHTFQPCVGLYFWEEILFYDMVRVNVWFWRRLQKWRSSSTVAPEYFGSGPVRWPVNFSVLMWNCVIRIRAAAISLYNR